MAIAGSGWANVKAAESSAERTGSPSTMPHQYRTRSWQRTSAKSLFRQVDGYVMLSIMCISDYEQLLSLTLGRRIFSAKSAPDFPDSSTTATARCEALKSPIKLGLLHPLSSKNSISASVELCCIYRNRPVVPQQIDTALYVVKSSCLSPDKKGRQQCQARKM